MADLALAYNDDARCADLCIAEGDLALDQGLASLVLSSLLTDARAAASELPSGEIDPRGWWGDALSATGPRGGLLWTLARAKATPEVMRRARDYAESALAWMVTDGIARSVSVTASRADGIGSGATLTLQIIITRPDGTREAVYYDRLWEALA